ncbi:MAG: carboxypeptidase regulatory-like domain-containing protein [Acidobacteriota bacterium]
MTARTPTRALVLLAGALFAPSVLAATTPVKLSGSIVGVVRDGAGIPQMGAAVVLYNRSERPLQRALTDEKGMFGFAALVPDVYAIRITLASFLPALKRNIAVQPGMQSLLNVNLASVFSSIELVYNAPRNGLMSDEWKWVLRSSSSTRPVLRFLPDFSEPARRAGGSPVFSEMRGMVKVSAGDQGHLSSLGAEPDLGTAFALATSVFGSNQFQVSGNLGYSANTGIPAAAFRTSFRRQLADGQSPEVRVTMRQLYLPLRAGASWLNGQQGGAPALRTLSATLLDRTQITGQVLLEYGFSMDSVTFLDRLNYFSPYARLTYDGGDSGVVQAAYASGIPPAELFGEGLNQAEFEQDLAALALFPRVSLRGGRARVQRSETLELGYRISFGSRTYSAAAYQERVSNAALTMAGAGLLASADLLPDLFSNSWILNAGEYSKPGYVASVTQNLGERLDLALAYGSGGVLTAGRTVLETGSPDELRSILRRGRRHSLTARLSGVAPRAGTQFVGSYQWASLRSLTPAHMFLTQRVREGLGMNLLVRQPIPAFGALPGRLEATADLRNLLAQGYVPLSSYGRRTYLVHTPRSLRGGLSFIF